MTPFHHRQTPLKTTKKQPRADAKFTTAADTLRRDIVRGVWKPGECLPTWDALCPRLAIQRPTLRHTLAILKAEGFIEADPTRTTRVTADPPHLSRYTLLFPSSPARHGPSGWNLFWDSLARQACVIAKEKKIRIDTFFDVSTHPDCPAYVKARDDIAKHRLAGVIVVRGGDLLNLVASRSSDTPVVHICSGGNANNAPSVSLDWPTFHTRAADLLLSCRCRNIAVLSDSVNDAQTAAAVLAKKGATTAPKWILAVPDILPDLARNITRLLVSRDSANRPDALLITDDNLIIPAVEGIQAEGLCIPRDILVLTHCNCPDPALPDGVIGLGFSARDAILSAVELCATRRQRPFPAMAIHPQPLL